MTNDGNDAAGGVPASNANTKPAAGEGTSMVRSPNRRKQPPGKSNADGAVLDEARQTITALEKRKIGKPLVDAEADHGRPRITYGRIRQYRALFDGTEQLEGQASGVRIAIPIATGDEQGARTDVFDVISTIREDVVTTYKITGLDGEDGGLTKAQQQSLFKRVGVGSKITDRLTGELLGLARSIVNDYRTDKAFAALLLDAGVTKKIIDDLDSKRATLADADTRQNSAIGLSAGLTITKRQAFTNLKRATAFFRNAALAISRRNKLGLENEFRSRRPKAKPRTRRNAKQNTA